jgi:hypothetical protein
MINKIPNRTIGIIIIIKMVIITENSYKDNEPIKEPIKVATLIRIKVNNYSI